MRPTLFAFHIGLCAVAGTFLAAACSDRRILTLLFDGVPPEAGAEGTAEAPASGALPTSDIPHPTSDIGAGFVLLDPGSPKALTVSSNHASFATQCANCHEANAAVTDVKCLTCHNDNVHQPGLPMTIGCGRCHAEHSGRDANLTRMSSANCTECHSEHPFEKLHPQFHLVEDAQAARLAKEATGLDMPHSIHLTARVPDGPREGQFLSCLDCHKLNATQPDSFQPIRYDEACAKCHEVEPHQQTPETSWNDLRNTLPEGADRAAPLLPAPRWRQFVSASADAAGMEKLQAARDALIDDGLEECFRCHGFVEQKAGRKMELVVAKTQYRTSWFDRLRFKHSAHFYIDCQTCHVVAANAEQEVGRLMLPGVETCAQCHHEGGAPNDCSTCHTFHTRSDRPPPNPDRSNAVRNLLQLSSVHHP